MRAAGEIVAPEGGSLNGNANGESTVKKRSSLVPNRS